MPADRRSLRTHRDALMRAGLGFVRRARALQRWINIVCVMGGGALGAVGGAMEGGLSPTAGDGLVTGKGVFVLLGATLVLIGGLLLLILSDEAPALLARAAALEGEAQRFLDERDALQSRISEQDARDARRLALIDAGRAMLEASENVFAAADLTLESAVETVLRAGQRSLLTAIDFERTEYWAISIFHAEGEQLIRVVAIRPDPLEERIEGRCWRRGEGFAGMAWQHDAEVIIADCNQADVRAAYPVAPANRLDTDEGRYRSMAVVPIRVGPDDRFWGVVAVSSDKTGRFRRQPGDQSTKNLETVRLIARTVELLAAGFARGATAEDLPR